MVRAPSAGLNRSFDSADAPGSRPADSFNSLDASRLERCKIRRKEG